MPLVATFRWVITRTIRGSSASGQVPTGLGDCRGLTSVTCAMSAQAARAPAATSDEPVSPARRPPIVAVDDEPAVLAAVARDLRRGFGERFRILRATSGADALKLVGELRARGDQIAMLIADQRM